MREYGVSQHPYHVSDCSTRTDPSILVSPPCSLRYFYVVSRLRPHCRHLPAAARLLLTNWSRSVHRRVIYHAAFTRIVAYFRFCGLLRAFSFHTMDQNQTPGRCVSKKSATWRYRLDVRHLQYTAFNRVYQNGS